VNGVKLLEFVLVDESQNFFVELLNCVVVLRYLYCVLGFEDGYLLGFVESSRNRFLFRHGLIEAGVVRWMLGTVSDWRRTVLVGGKLKLRRLRRMNLVTEELFIVLNLIMTAMNTVFVGFPLKRAAVIQFIIL